MKERYMAYLYLALAILAEVAATSALKASKEFTKLGPSMVVLVGYGAAFYFMTLVLRTIPIGITYAVWSGIGIVLIALVGAIFYKQIPDPPAVIGMGLIISGVVVIHLFSKTVGH
jgi:small multidrug resistance pump